MNVDHGSSVVPAGGSRNYRFDGALLGVSSSRRPGGQRWVEFALYKSDGGTYILARVGHSLLFHEPDCEVVARNDLRIGPAPVGGVPCELCLPALDASAVYPEMPRYWAAMFTDPGSVIRALERDGESGRYVTNVAAKPVEAAAVRDKAIADAWMSVRID